MEVRVQRPGKCQEPIPGGCLRDASENGRCWQHKEEILPTPTPTKGDQRP